MTNFFENVTDRNHIIKSQKSLCFQEDVAQVGEL